MKRYARLSLFVLLVLLLAGVAIPALCRSENKIPAGFVDVKKMIPSVQLDIRYAGLHNFVGERVDGYGAPKCILTKEAAAALAKVQEQLRPFSLGLKVYDGYRPQRAVDHFVRWAKNIGDTKTKREFYPTLEKENLFKDEYIALKSGHSRGSTVDLTIVPSPASTLASWQPGDKLEACYSPVAIRFPDNGLDMGTGFDCFHERSHTANGTIGWQQRANRLLLKTLMERQGFVNYEKEWWHFTLKNEPFPQTYFDFVIE